MTDSLLILADNRARAPYRGEHGFSLLIRLGGRRVLFDTGAGEALFANAREAGVSLEGLDALVLSHGHYDHTGNLARLLQMNPRLPVYAHPGCLVERFSFHRDGSVHKISMAEADRRALSAHPPSLLHWTEAPEEVVPGLTVSGEIPRVHPEEDPGGAFFRDPRGEVPDIVPDDMALWIDRGDSLALLCGCCHGGIRNTLDHMSALAPGKGVSLLTGGFHLRHAGQERMAKTLACLEQLRPERLIPCHCTGEAAEEAFLRLLPGSTLPGRAGLSLPL